jgi:uncharacterized protein YprB with RNaseH-like and TPR domain/predicted nuclease with RNAse H fold/dephospho-CoA kinase
VLERTFLHLPGISEKRERKLWTQGVTSLLQLREASRPQLDLFSETPTDDLLERTLLALDENDLAFFSTMLPRREHYRIALTYPSEILYLDIETTGLSRYYDTITLVGWSDHRGYSYWVRGESPQALLSAISNANILVTFNGTLFDLPFIRKEFPEWLPPLVHIDLRFLAQRVGLRGGQKKIETILGLTRGKGARSLKSSDAPVLWQRFVWGDIVSGNLLLSYNLADVQGLAYLLAHCSRALLDSSQVLTPSALEALAMIDLGSTTSARRPLRVTRSLQRRAKPKRQIALKHLWEEAGLGTRVVGIDLTGSEKRPSGWCLLGAKKAETSRVASDDELMRVTLTAKPDLVSIDSPLTLPRGRRTPWDTDSHRKSFGITRHCERELFRRGVRVYPCLLPSMQALTARGIRLATELRRLGVPVIESFPGAAQDILGLPRKRASEELLALGLKHLGIRGAFWHTRISHDELDAITSALVGLFFLARRYEAMGNPAEDYLIVPSLELPKSWPRVLGLSGPIGAGKTTAANFLATNGLQYLRYSQTLSRLLTARDNTTPSRERLQDYGLRIHTYPGQRWLNSQLLSELRPGWDVVIDGLRWPEDHSFLFERFPHSYVHLHIDAPEEVRRLRCAVPSVSAWRHMEEHGAEAGVRCLRPLAHVRIDNSGTVADLYGHLTQALLGRPRPTCAT